MKWKLRIVAIAVTGLLLTASTSMGQQSRTGRKASNSSPDANGTVLSVSDDAVSRISVGDEEPTPPAASPSRSPQPSSQVPPLPVIPSGNYSYYNAGYDPSNGAVGYPPGYANPACTGPGCSSPGCTNPGCTSPGCTGPGYGCTDMGGYGPGCGRRFHGYVGIEYLQVWGKGMGTPPLASTDTPPGQGQIGPGLTGTVLFGGNTIGTQLQPSGRVTGGLWLDESETDGVVVRVLGLGGARNSFNGNSAGFPVLASPFNNVGPVFQGPDANDYSFPGTLNGSLSIKTAMNLYNTDAFFRWNVDRDSDYRIDLIGGYQNSLLTSGVTIDGFATSLAGPAAGTTFDIRDGFAARNSFNGGVIGLMGEAGRGPWTITALAKVGLGQMHQSLKINGNSTVNDGINPPQVFAGGLYAQPTNIGSYTRNRFGVVPELGFTLNRTMNRNWDFNFGYTFMYWNSVIAAGNQINPNINGTQLLGGALAGAPQPSPLFNSTSYYINAISFGLTYHY